MNTKLKILTILLMVHASTHSMIIQPELSKKSKAKLTLYDKARSTYNNALKEYKKLHKNEQKYRFSFSTFDFIHHPIAQKYYDANDSLFELALELTEIDPDNFMMTSGGDLYRKVFTHQSLGTYEWVPYKDYDMIIENLDEFQKKLNTKRDSSMLLFDPVSKESINLINDLYRDAEEIRQTILRAYFL